MKRAANPVRGWRRSLSWVAMLACLGFVGWLFIKDPDALESLREVTPLGVLEIVGASILYLVVQAYRQWIVLIRCGGEHVPLLYWVRVFVVGRALNMVVPQSGNVYRGVQLKTDHGVTYTEYITLFVAFTWIASALNLALAAVAILVVEPTLAIGGINAALLTASVSVGLLALPHAVAALVPRLPFTRRQGTWATRRLDQLFVGALALLRNGRLLVELVLSGVLVLAIACGLFWLTFSELGVGVGIAESALLFVLVQTSNYVIITPGNLGLQEALLGVLANELGYPATVGVLVSAVLRAGGYLALAVVGVALAGRELRGLMRRRRAARRSAEQGDERV